MTKLAVITGASRGIGHALVLELAKRGIEVVAIARNQDGLEWLQAKYSSKIAIIPADITTSDGRNKIASILQNKKIHYLINNAAIIKPIGPLHKSPEHDIEQLFKTNLLSQIFLTNKLIPFFESSDGRILNVTSVAGSQSIPGIMPYCISKAGLDRWTDGLKKELPPHIAVADVVPGEVATPMQGDLRDAPLDQFQLATEFKEAEKQNTLIPPAECAKFLADVLLKTSKEQFSNNTWNIYHHYKGIVPQPLNRKKLVTEKKPEYSITVLSHFSHKPKTEPDSLAPHPSTGLKSNL